MGIPRQQYMRGHVTHYEYYGSMITSALIAEFIAVKGERFFTKLIDYDNIGWTMQNSLRKALLSCEGEIESMAGRVCLLKAIERKIAKEPTLKMADELREEVCVLEGYIMEKLSLSKVDLAEIINDRMGGRIIWGNEQ